MIGLGQAKSSDLLHACHRWQPALLLFFRAEHRDRVHSQSRVDAKERADAGIATGQLQHDETGGRQTYTRATIAFDSRSGDVEDRELGDEFQRELDTLRVAVEHGVDYLHL